MATTTLYTILANYDSVLKALTPAQGSDVTFDTHKPTVTLEEWVENNGGSGLLRKYEWIPDGIDEEPDVVNPSAVLRMESVTLRVCYPRENSRYATSSFGGIVGMRNMMRTDSRQLRDAVFSPSNYVSGQCSAIPNIQAPTEFGDAWFQDISILLTYYEAQSL